MLTGEDQIVNLENFKSKQINKDSETGTYEIVDNETKSTHIAFIFEKDITKYPKERLDEFFTNYTMASKVNHPSILKYIGYSPKNFSNKPLPVLVTDLTQYKTLYSMIDSCTGDFKSSKFNSTKFIII